MTRTLYRGGRIYSPVPDATALVVDDARIAWVGTDAAAGGLGACDAVVELGGAWVAPAFVDAHVHVVAAGLALTTLDLTRARSLEHALDQVRRCAQPLPAGALIWGTGWDETRWQAGPRRPPTPDELARAADGRPVYLTRTDIHSAVASPMLLQAAGLDPRPVSARGPVSGAAHHAVRRAARRLLTADQRRAAADAYLAGAARQGIGMVHECSGPEIGDTDELAVVREAATELGINLVAYWGQLGTAGIEQAAALGAAPGGDLFLDGSLGSHTAALTEDYADAAGRGLLLLDEDDVAQHVIVATRAGMQTGFHVIGDAAVELATRGFERAAAALGRGAVAGARHRLEHLEMCGPLQRQRLARLGIVASVQPAFDARWGGPDGMYAARLGPERAEAMNNFAALASVGIALIFGSDAPVTSVTPWETILAATNTHSRAHALSARAAFLAHTRGGQRAARRDAGGVLREGADADFAVWAGVSALTGAAAHDRRAGRAAGPATATAGLPDLDAPPPTCVRTVVNGRAIFVGEACT